MKREEIQAKVYQVIEDVMCVDRDQINDEADIKDDLGADSLDAVEVIMNTEKEFNIAIPDSLSEGVKTVGNLVDLVVTQLEAKE